MEHYIKRTSSGHGFFLDTNTLTGERKSSQDPQYYF